MHSRPKFAKHVAGSVDGKEKATVKTCLLQQDFFQICIGLVATLALTSSYMPVMIPPSIGLIVLFYFVTQAFLRTSRPLMRMLGIANAPVFSQASASLQGLTTIRTFSTQKILLCDFCLQLVSCFMDNLNCFHFPWRKRMTSRLSNIYTLPSCGCLA